MNLLCSSALAKHPFVIPALNLRIYSGEELCYFIYHNPVLLDDHFLNEELLRFIEVELALPAAAKRLSRFQSANDRQVQLMAIMREFCYYPEEQLRQFQKMLEQQQRKLPFLRMIDKGDAFLSQKRYQAALQVYQQLLTRTDMPGCTEEQLSRICCQMALANCGMGLYQRAVEYLRQAYVHQPDLEVVKLAWQIAKLGGVSLTEDWIAVNAEEQAQWRQEYEELEQQVRLEENTGELTAIQALDSIRRAEALSQYAAAQKDMYRENTQTASA